MIDKRYKLRKQGDRAIKQWLSILALFVIIMLWVANTYSYNVEPVSPQGPLTSSAPNLIQMVEASEEQSSGVSADDIVDAIWMLESSRGTTGNPGSLQHYCESRGMSNEYGYGGMKLKICFESHEKATTRIIKWVNKYYTKFDNDLGRTACYYNLGIDQPDCKYYQDMMEVMK